MTNVRPQSELYREAAMRWADLDAAARMLEEGKTAVFSQRVGELLKGGSPVAKAEVAVRGSASWQDYVEKMVRARTAANRAKVELEFIRMQHWEKTQDRADQRFEARLAP